MFAVDTQKGFAVERHTVDKIDKRLMQFLNAVSVSVHMVFVDIGHDGHNRRQIQERGIGFVGFGNNVFAFTQTSVGTSGVELAADNESRVKSCRAENRSGQAGGCGLPCVPAMAIPSRKRINSANISARGITGICCSNAATTSGLSFLTAVEVTTTSAPLTCSAV